MKRTTLFTRVFSLLALAGLLLAFTPAQAAVLSGTQINVTTNADELNNDGDCSLREALRAANTNLPIDACPAGGDADTIRLPQGTFMLTLTGAGENLGLSGDLDISSNVTIIGAGRALTFLDGYHADRVLHITGAYTVNISHLTIRNGSVPELEKDGGGGIYNRGSLTLFSVILTDNTSSNTGGGLDNIGVANLRQVTIMGNTAKQGGGAFNGQYLTTDSVTFSSNTSTLTGGGLDNGGNAILNNTTISNNTSAEGGGVFNDGTVTFNNSTIYLNTQALFLGLGEMRFRNTIIANSTSGDNCQKREGVTATFTSLGNNLDSGNTCSMLAGVDLINANPLLNPLQENDGVTYTHALQSGSPAIDRGDNPSCMPMDQRGRLRPADGNLDGTFTCDIGAFEYNGDKPFSVYLPTALKR